VADIDESGGLMIGLCEDGAFTNGARIEGRPVVRRLRLVSGLILFAYIVTHLFNHSLGIASIGTMEAMLSVIYPLWSYPPVTAILYGALIAHMALALYALWQRRSLKIPPNEAVQYVLGFSVPLLLAEHVTNTRIDAAVYGGDFGHYRYLLSALWYGNPRQGYLQMTLLFAAWIHACIGLRFWLRLRPWYDRAQPLFFGAALLLPVFALLGFVAGEREIGVVLAQDRVTWSDCWLASHRLRHGRRSISLPGAFASFFPAPSLFCSSHARCGMSGGEGAEWR
jgi:adenylate cyclase